MAEAESRSQHVFMLARDLLDDIELSRLSSEALLLKASRLARLAGTEEEKTWLNYELVGYRSGNPTAERFLSLTGRWINREKGTAYLGPFAQQEAAIESLKLQLQSLSTQGLGGQGSHVAVARISTDAQAIGNKLSQIGGVRSRVLGLLHKFASRVYYEKLFSRLAESIFERYQHIVDSSLAASAGEILEKLPTVYDRLAEGDPEAISQAMTTCRRMINAFADAVFPAGDQAVVIDGQSLEMGKDKPQNRINAFVAERTTSKSRRKRLRQSLSNVYDRVCAGVHDDVTPEEAQALVLATYLLLGEISTIPKASS